MKKAVFVGFVLIFLAGVVLVAKVGLGYYARHETFAPSTELDEQCDEVPVGASRLTFTGADGFTLGAALVGPPDAEVGLVLRQGASQKICEWLPWAGEVAAQTGARVLLFDRRGRGSSPGEGNLSKEPEDTLLAIDYLRDEGVAEVALASSSMGNSIVFSTLPQLSAPACALISISPVLVSGDGFGTVDGSSLEGLPQQVKPGNVWVAWETGNAGVADAAERIVEQAGSGGVAAHALSIETDDHSRQLVLNHSEVQDFFLDAVRSCSSG